MAKSRCRPPAPSEQKILDRIQLRLLEMLGPPDGKRLMLDALHSCQKALRQTHHDNGTDFLIPVNGNHPGLESRTAACLPDRTPAAIPLLGHPPGAHRATRAARYRRNRR